jgi:SAM-dependent methyltransferase
VESQYCRVLRVVPRSPCAAFLELCCGAGPACLTAARHFAGVACGIDINARALRFAKFNRLLNCLDNVSLECGDAFGSISGTSFDRIVAHPPYEPVLGRDVVFQDGGLDGERISAAILRRLPEHLTRGAAFYAYLLLSDRRGDPAELRVREMLGPAHKELDVLLLVNRQRPVLRLPSCGIQLQMTPRAVRLLEICDALEIEQLLITGLVIRPKRGRCSVTRRRLVPAYFRMPGAWWGEEL